MPSVPSVPRNRESWPSKAFGSHPVEAPTKSGWALTTSRTRVLATARSVTPRSFNVPSAEAIVRTVSSGPTMWSATSAAWVAASCRE